MSAVARSALARTVSGASSAQCGQEFDIELADIADEYVSSADGEVSMSTPTAEPTDHDEPTANASTAVIPISSAADANESVPNLDLDCSSKILRQSTADRSEDNGAPYLRSSTMLLQSADTTINGTYYLVIDSHIELEVGSARDFPGNSNLGIPSEDAERTCVQHVLSVLIEPKAVAFYVQWSAWGCNAVVGGIHLIMLLLSGSGVAPYALSFRNAIQAAYWATLAFGLPFLFTMFVNLHWHIVVHILTSQFEVAFAAFQATLYVVGISLTFPTDAVAVTYSITIIPTVVLISFFDALPLRLRRSRTMLSLMGCCTLVFPAFYILLSSTMAQASTRRLTITVFGISYEMSTLQFAADKFLTLAILYGKNFLFFVFRKGKTNLLQKAYSLKIR